MNNTGGPAFPHHVVCDKGWSETKELQGMTLRDYFAAKAMQAMESSGLPKSVLAIEVARAAYEMADAMLKARET